MARRGERRTPMRRQEEVEEHDTRRAVAAGMADVKKTCARCHIMKIRCDQRFPCTRCFRLCLRCRPRARGNHTNHSEKKRDPPVLDVPLLGYVFEHADKAGLAETFLAVFRRVHAEGNVAREMVLSILSHWRGCSVLLDTDVTHGVSAGLTTICNIGSAEIQKSLDATPLARLGIKWDNVPVEQRQALLAAEIQKAQALSAHLQRTQAFSFMHTMSPATPLIMAIVNATTNRMSLAVNTPYGEHFHTSGEMARDLFEHKTLNILLFAGLLAPDDRESYFEAIIHGLMVKNGPSNFAYFVKLFNRRGEIELYIFKARKFQATEGYGMIFHIHPCPPSRHISATPHHRIVSQRFRQIRGQGRENGAGKGNEQEKEEEEEEEQQAAAAWMLPAFFQPPAASLPPPPPVSLQLRGFATLPLPLPPFLHPQGAPNHLLLEDEERLESIFRLSYGPASLPACEPPLPSASWDEEEEEERDSYERKRSRKAAEARADHPAHLRRGKRIRTPTRPSSGPFPPAAAPVHAPIPRPLPPLSSSSALSPPLPFFSPSFSSSRGRPPYDEGGGERRAGQGMEGQAEENRESPPALGQFEQVKEELKQGEAEEGTGGGGVPLVMESDLDFLIDFFDAEKEIEGGKEDETEGGRQGCSENGTKSG